MTAIEEQARSLFLAALERAPEQWAAFLDQACGGNAELRARVEQLLRAHHAMGSIEGGGADALAPTADEPPLTEGPGTVIGPYKLLQEIGEGGMGTVFMAEQTQPVQRKVALKIIKPGMDSRQVLARFEAERQALALMDHPNIAKVLDAGTTGFVVSPFGGASGSEEDRLKAELQTGRPYFVMELVKGTPITRYCDEHHLTPKQRLELFLPVCQAVQHAHQKGIIHRDLKPSNVLVAEYDDKPVPKVIDFGVVKATGPKLTERTLFTEFGAVVGTLEYMSPEQAKLNALDIDTRSDIYALGVLLYELLTGTPPFDRKRLHEAAFDEVLRIIREEEPPKPSTRLSTTEELPSIAANRGTEPKKLCGLVKGELDWIVMKCLEKDRNRRYETANGLAMDLQRYLADEPVQACPPSAAYRLRKFVRRHHGPVAAVAAVAVTLLLGTIISSFFAVQAFTQRKRALEQKQLADLKAAEAQANAQRADAQAEEATANAEEARARLYISDMRLTQRAWEAGQHELVAELLAAHAPERSGREDLRGFEWYYWDRLSHSEEFLLQASDYGTVRSVIFSPDGKRLASAHSHGTVVLWDLSAEATDQDVLLLEGHDFPGDAGTVVAFSPDSRRIAAVSGVEIKVWDLANGQVLFTLKGHKGGVGCVAFSPDGKLLASGRQSDEREVGDTMDIRIWDAVTGKETLRLKGHDDYVTCVAFSPDSKRLASAGYDNLVKVWDLATGQATRTIEQQGWVNSVAFSPDGKRLAAASDDGGVKVWDAVSGHQVVTLSGQPGSVVCVAFSPDGRQLASASSNFDSPGAVKLWQLSADAQGVARAEEIVSFRVMGGDEVTAGGSVAFSPDGEWLAAADGQNVKVWTVATDPGPLRCQGHRQDIDGVAFSPDGKLLATVGQVDKTLKTWDAISGQQILSLRRNFQGAVAFSPDGKQLAAADGTSVFLCDPISGEELRTLPGHRDAVGSVAFSLDGKLLAAGVPLFFLGGQPGEIRIWEVATGRQLRTIEDELALSIAFSPDGTRVASARWNGTIIVWDVATGRELLTLEGHSDGVFSVAFSADCRLIASGSADRTVRLWNSSSGEPLRVLRGHTTSVNCVMFSPDGRRLASSSRGSLGSGEVKIWVVALGQETFSLSDPKGYSCVGFSPDGMRLAAGSWQLLQVWDARPFDDDRRLEQQAVSFYRQVLSELWRRDQIIERIRQDGNVNERARQMALAWAQWFREDPARLNQAAWDIARHPDRSADEFRQALGWAESAVERQADEMRALGEGTTTGEYIEALKTLGVARCRLGEYRTALEALTDVDKFWGTIGSSNPVALAFMAMAQHHLGQKEEAQSTLKRLREVMQSPKWAKDDQAQAAFREAETVVGNENPK